MTDEIYSKLPNKVTQIIAHQQIRDDLLKDLSFDIYAAKDSKSIAPDAKKNMVFKCRSLFREWMASKNPDVLAKIPFNETGAPALKVIEWMLSSPKLSIAAVFVKLNEICFGFQQEMEKKYGG